MIEKRHLRMYCYTYIFKNNYRFNYAQQRPLPHYCTSNRLKKNEIEASSNRWHNNSKDFFHLKHTTFSLPSYTKIPHIGSLISVITSDNYCFLKLLSTTKLNNTTRMHYLEIQKILTMFTVLSMFLNMLMASSTCASNFLHWKQHDQLKKWNEKGSTASCRGLICQINISNHSAVWKLESNIQVQHKTNSV